MTKNEVELHQAETGSTALALVSGIKLMRNADGTFRAEGGDCYGEIGWRISDCTLEPIAYRITRPSLK